MASQKQGTLYTGVTSDLSRRTYEHREAAKRGFTKTYRVKRPVWYEMHESIAVAAQRADDQAL